MSLTVRESWTGMVFALASTMLYGLSNSMLRLLTQYDVPNDWMLFYKELTGLCFLIPWLLFRLCQGRYEFTSRRLIFYGIVAAVLCELVGARLQLLGFAVAGLVIAVPVIQSSTLLGTAIFGKIFLGDPLSQKRVTAMFILIAAIIILNLGKSFNAHNAAELISVSDWYFTFVAFGTFIAGTAFAIYIVLMRFVVLRDWDSKNSLWLSFQFSHWAGRELQRDDSEKKYSAFPVSLMMSLVLGSGVAVFGSCLYLENSVKAFYDVPSFAWYIIPISGIANFVGFFFQVHSLRMTTAVQASLISVSQMLVLSVVGYVFFGEMVNSTILLGLFLTAFGIIMSAKPER